MSIPDTFRQHLRDELANITAQGLLKNERTITSQQRTTVTLADGREVTNLCANNYLGLANHPRLIAAAQKALTSHGFGMASVRFICGAQDLHHALEARIAKFLGTESAILFSSCWDANGGVFEILLGENDAVISDALNHASIIDGIRLCKAKRLRYPNGDLTRLEECLKEAGNARFKLVVTDGVFSMDGVIANLKALRELTRKYGALLMVDDSHAVGVLGAKGRGTAEYCGAMDGVDIYTGTFGKALGGASGGYVAASADIVKLLRQRARPYLFSNSLMPAIAAATLEAIDMVENGAELREKLGANAAFFRKQMSAAGFRLAGADHPIIPVMVGDARRAATMAEALLQRGVYVVGFSYPVVPEGQARIRVQLSAAHTTPQLEHAVAAFTEVARTAGNAP